MWVQHSCSLRDPRWDLTKKTHETSSKGINSSARTHSSKGFGRRGRGHTIPRLCRGSSSGSVAESNTCSWGQQVTVFLYSNKSQFSCSGAQPVAPAGPVPLQRLPQIRLLHLCLEHKGKAISISFPLFTLISVVGVAASERASEINRKDSEIF